MKIEALIERLEGLSGPDREVGHQVISHLISVDDPDAKKFYGDGRDVTASLDAAIALVEKVLPGWRIENLGEWDHEQLRSRGPWMCDLMPRGKSFKDCFPAKCAHAPSPAIALLIAMFRALAAGGSDA